MRISYNLNGSVLVFSLIVLAIMISGALAIATASIINRQSVGDSVASGRSFQTANSGVELILQKVYKGTYTDLNALAVDFGGGACSGGVITNSAIAGGKVSITFLDKDGAAINCTDTSWRSKVVRMKSEGTASGTTRVVETAVAAGADYGWVNIDLGDYAGPSPIVGTVAPLSYINYSTSGSNHTPEKMCQAAGYSTFTGACKTVSTAWGGASIFDFQGSLVSGVRSDGSSFISCELWNGMYYFDNAVTSKILCIK